MAAPKVRGRTALWLILIATCRSPNPPAHHPATPKGGEADTAVITPPDLRPPPLARDAEAVSVEPEPEPDAGPAVDVPAPDAPPPAGTFENSLGMRFVRVPVLAVRVSIWETRVRDFEAYARATGATVPHPEFPETALQPKASVSRAEDEAFAHWLTMKEQADGTIGAGQRYRLPTDAEWDAAIGVGQTGGPFPWGSGFPPPDHFANYGLTQDGFTYTAPAGSFPPNALGLYDLAGNLWEWIGQGCASGGGYLVRGAGWNARGQSYLTLAFHYCFGGDLVGHHNVGFRLVLEGGGP